VEVKILSDLDETLNLSIYLLESHFENWQKDYDAAEEDISDYEHNHIIRGAITNTWGIELASGAVATDSIIEAHYSYNLDEEWVDANCEVVAFVYDFISREVYQAVQKAIIE